MNGSMNGRRDNMPRIVLALSGGPDTFSAIPWLAACDAEVVTVTVDLGQGRDLADVRERALELGARRAHVVDARLDLVRECVLPALQSGALYDGECPYTPAFARIIVARTLMDVARMEGAAAVAHLATGEDRVAFEKLVRARDSQIEVIPVRETWKTSGVHVSRQGGSPPPATGSISVARVDATVWGRSVLAPAESVDVEASFVLTRAASECPDRAAMVEIAFEHGIPVSVNGIEMPLLELIESLETIAGAHGVGRYRMAANSGHGTIGVCEAPAAAVLHTAHRELESRCVPAELAGLKPAVARVYADLVRNGEWFSRARQALASFTGVLQTGVNGSVRLQLSKGRYDVLGVRPAAADDCAASAPLVLHPSA
jgi:argininosuccinate synthase